MFNKIIDYKIREGILRMYNDCDATYCWKNILFALSQIVKVWKVYLESNLFKINFGYVGIYAYIEGQILIGLPVLKLIKVLKRTKWGWQGLVPFWCFFFLASIFLIMQFVNQAVRIILWTSKFMRKLEERMIFMIFSVSPPNYAKSNNKSY